ncbi:MAG TPA: DUF2318 domain-containing protein [Thermoleophilia bacterium]|nr:DUF2318 domain-containing protein [Thermoleophilia bacterium]
MAKRRQHRSSVRTNAQPSSATRRTSGQTARGGGKSTVREQKRAQFSDEAAGRRSRLPLVVAAAAIIAVAAVAGAFLLTRGNGTATATTTVAATGDVRIPLADLAGGEAKFFTYDAGGTTVKYFVMKSSDGEYRAAFDACDVCFANKKGYHQEGDEMVCNNCGRRFPSTKINVLEGGCNPGPIERTVKGQDLVLTTAELDAGARYFQ